MSSDVEISEVPAERRPPLEKVLEESFTGIYLRHARRTLGEVETVRAAYLDDGEPVGLSMLKVLPEKAGYVYYIAVRSSFQRKGYGKRLLHDAIGYLRSRGVSEVYASVGEDNAESNALFKGNGFRRTSFAEVSRRYGMLKAMAMYRSMFVVPGEVLLVLDGPSMTSFVSEEVGPTASGD